LTAGAARPNPQGSFHYGSISPSQSFIFRNSAPVIDGHQRFAVNNISFVPTTTPLKLADFFNISSGVYTLDGWPSIYSIQNSMVVLEPTLATAVVTGRYKAFVEIVFENNEATLQSWHLDGYDFWVVG
jgi:iron transport multicopper oxidase